MAIPEMVRGALPVLVSTTFLGSPSDPTGCKAKSSFGWEKTRNGPLTPTPFKGMTCGLLRVPSVRVMVLDLGPNADGEKLRLMEQLAPGERLAPQLFVA